MRKFFKTELETLYAKTQLRQYETLSAMPDAKIQIKAMLDALERVCSYYAYIPDEAKQAIILDRMLKDEDFIGFNAKIVSKWFEQAKGKYFVEEAHKPVESNARAVTYEELSPEVREAFDRLVKALSADGKKMPKVSQKEIDDLKIELGQLAQGLDVRREGKQAFSAGVRYSTEEDYILQQKKIEWARECTDLHTGKLKPGSPDFETWSEQQTKEI